MRITILGDSWGYPFEPTAYTPPPGVDPQHITIRQPDPSHTHVANRLRTSHNLVNTARPGSGNFTAINRALTHEADLLIWFHTETLRDRLRGQEFYVETLAQELAVEAYHQFHELETHLGAQAIVIGGQAPVYTQQYLEICNTPLLLIPNWHSSILGETLPWVHWLNTLDVFEDPLCLDSAEDKLRMLEQANTILDLDSASELFPDNAHPGRVAHDALFNQITDLIK